MAAFLPMHDIKAMDEASRVRMHGIKAVDEASCASYPQPDPTYTLYVLLSR